MLFGGFGVWYTYETATNIMDKNWSNVLERQPSLMTDFSSGALYIDSDSEAITYLYRDFERNAVLKSDDIGCYEVYISDEGEKIEAVTHLRVDLFSQKIAGERYIPVASDSQHDYSNLILLNHAPPNPTSH